MSYPKVCLNCDTPFEAKRDSARFCGEGCKNDWHAENRAASSQVPGQRVTPHALDEVRGLHDEHKGDWTAIVREHARRTLLITGYLSAADFEALGVPDEHRNLPNAQIGGLAGAGYMEAISFKRWPARVKASRKSGKYWIYRITTKGKEKLSPLVGGSGEPASGASQLAAASSQDQEPTIGLDAQETRKGERNEVEQSLTAPSTGRGPGNRAVPHGAGSPQSVEPGGGSDEVGPTLRQKRGASPPVGAAADLVAPPDQSQDTIAGEGAAASTVGVPDSSSVAGGGVPGVLQLDESRPKPPSMYDPMEDAA